MTALRDSSTSAQPTSENPATIAFGTGDIVLSRVAYWHEDGQHVIRSLEYDVIAASEDLFTAIRKFALNTVEYARMLSEAEDRTPEDAELASMIFDRLGAVLAEIEVEPPQRRGGLLTRVRHHRGQQVGHGWRLHHAALN